MFEVHKVGEVIGGDAFLIVTESKAAMVDTGFAFTAKKVAKNVKKILGDRKLDYILLTHSHYDHVSGAMACKRMWKDAVIVSAEHAAKVFEKPSAIKRMNKLNRAAALTFKKLPFYGNQLKGLHTDRIVKEGDIIDLGSLKLKVLESPGHTWDTIAFWSEEEKFLVANETVGVVVTDEILQPACLVSHKKCVEFVNKVKEWKPEKVLVPHYQMIYGKDCDNYLELSLKWHDIYKKYVLEEHSKGITLEELMKKSKEKYWVGPVKAGQPEIAFDMNSKNIIPTIIKEYCDDAKTE